MKTLKSIVRSDTENGQVVGEAIVGVVEKQIRDGAPPETKETLERLIELGETRQNAIRYIACVLSVEIFDALKKNSSYNEGRYIRNLKALPELPSSTA